MKSNFILFVILLLCGCGSTKKTQMAKHEIEIVQTNDSKAEDTETLEIQENRTINVKSFNDSELNRSTTVISEKFDPEGKITERTTTIQNENIKAVEDLEENINSSVDEKVQKQNSVYLHQQQRLNSNSESNETKEKKETNFPYKIAILVSVLIILFIWLKKKGFIL